MTTAPLRKTGIDFVGDVPWGTHFCQFFETKDDLLETLLPYFKAGLEENEFCLWLIAEPTTTDEASNALRRAVPDLERYEADGSIEIHQCQEWFLNAGAFDLGRMISAWDKKLAQALDKGFPGMRANGSPAWLQRKDWYDLSEFDQKLNEWITDKRMLASCSYPLAATGAAVVLDVTRTHDFALAKRNGKWEVVETPEFREAKADIRRRQPELLGALAVLVQDGHLPRVLRAVSIDHQLQFEAHEPTHLSVSTQA